MAQWVLAADFRWRDGIVLRAGKVLDDTIFPVAQMQAAGANIVAATTASLAASAAALKALAAGSTNLLDVGAAATLAGAVGGAGQPSPMGGDVTGTTAASILSAISGASPINITPATLQWLEATSSPTLAQAAHTSDLACQSINLTPQAAFASATGANRKSGDVNVNLAQPTNGGAAEAYLKIFRAGSANPIGLIGPTISGGVTQGFGLSANVSAPTANQENAYFTGATTWLNGPTGGGQVILAANGSTVMQAVTSAINFNVPLQGLASGTPFKLGSSALTVANTGTSTLTGANQQTPILVASVVTLTGAATIDFGNVTGFYLLNATGITLSAQTLTLKNGTATIVVSPLLSANKTLIAVVCSANAIAAG
jgi:hypothetical protein